MSLNKRFMFINLSIGCGYNTGFNQGIAYLAPIAKKYSYTVDYLNIEKELSCKEFKRKINKFKPSIIAFSLTSQQLKFLIKYSHALTNYKKLLKIAGGTGPTLDAIKFLSKASIDGVCIGEGERPLKNLFENIKNKKDIKNTKGFYWKNNNHIKKNDLLPPIENLSRLDFPDYELFNSVIKDKAYFVLSRGCPYSCHYCCNKALRDVYPSPPRLLRRPSVKYCIQLIQKVIKKYPEVKKILFQDDLLIADKNWFLRFIREYNKKINLPYGILARWECINKDIVNVLRTSKCEEICMGLESGDEVFRKKYLNRLHSNKEILKKAKMLKDEGIPLFTFNIVGFPFETKKQMNNTLELNKKIKPNNGVCVFFYPYKNTELYRICKEKNLIKKEKELVDVHDYNTKPAIKMTAKQEKECIEIQKKMNNYFRFQKKTSS